MRTRHRVALVLLALLLAALIGFCKSQQSSRAVERIGSDGLQFNYQEDDE